MLVAWSVSGLWVGVRLVGGPGAGGLLWGLAGAVCALAVWVSALSLGVSPPMCAVPVGVWLIPRVAAGLRMPAHKHVCDTSFASEAACCPGG